jgi:aerobic carbon-monoxide dehydrogenase small subunit
MNSNPGVINSTDVFVFTCEVNGTPVQLSVNPARRLLDILREDLRLTGTKISCEMGRCGACMVLIDGRPFNSCLIMAYQCAGKQITTIEGVAGEELDTVQQAFLAEGAFQCGYCTPGMVISLKGLLNDNANPTLEEVKEGLTGNLCRCTGYGSILRAAQCVLNARKNKV